jgi:hypothetical protein
MQMTFEDYINNPMGKSSAVMTVAHREIMKGQYKVKFDNILLREKGKLDYRLFKDSKNNTYWIYCKVPSELCKNFYYDTLIKFSADEKVKSGGRDLFKYYARFYSNDPAFVYTYAYVFAHNKLFIDELSSKMSKEALRSKPSEKNPREDIGYVKSIYFVYLLMQNRNLNKVSVFEKQSDPLDANFLMNNIMPADQKIAEREEAGRGVSQRKKVKIDDDMLRKVNRLTKGNLSDRAKDRLAITTNKKVNKISNIGHMNNIGNVGKKNNVNTIKSIQKRKKK